MSTLLINMAVIGGLTLLTYVVYGLKTPKGVISLAGGTTAFLASGATVMGVRVCELAISTDIKLNVLSHDRLFLLLAGVCVLWLNVDTVRCVFQSVRHPRAGDFSRATVQRPQA